MLIILALETKLLGSHLVHEDVGVRDNVVREWEQFVDTRDGAEDSLGMFALFACLGRAPDIIAQVVLLDDLEHLAGLCLFHEGLLTQHGLYSLCAVRGWGVMGSNGVLSAVLPGLYVGIMS